MSKSDDVYGCLRREIEQGALAPGYRLVVENLARDHGVSALPVREALRRLQAEGLVSYANHVGARVSPVDCNQQAELLETLGVLEAWILTLAMPMASAWSRTWRGCVQDLAQVVERRELPAFYAQHQEIMAQWHAACPNRSAVLLGEQVAARLYRGTKNVVLWSPRTADDMVHAHYQILQSVAEGAPSTLVEELVRALFRYLAKAMRTVNQGSVAPLL